MQKQREMGRERETDTHGRHCVYECERWPSYKIDIATYRCKKSLDKKMCVGYKTEVDIRTCMEGQSGL